MRASVGIYLKSCGYTASAGCCRWYADVHSSNGQSHLS